MRRSGSPRSEDALVFAIVTIPDDSRQMTANLQGPLILNRRTHAARQSISSNPRWGVRHVIVEELAHRRGSAEGGRALMLILARRIGESIMIGDQVEISVVDIKGDQVKLGIKAPAQVKVYRSEVYAAIQEENRAAASAAPAEPAEDRRVDAEPRRKARTAGHGPQRRHAPCRSGGCYWESASSLKISRKAPAIPRNLVMRAGRSASRFPPPCFPRPARACTASL